MADIGRFLEQQRAGEHDSEGVFTLDPSKSRDKLRHFQLPQADFCWLKIVQAGVAWKATAIKVTSSRKTVVFQFEGELELEDMARWPALFANPLAIESRAERHLAMGCMGALNLSSEIVWSYEHQGKRYLLTVAPDSLSLEDVPGDGGPARLTFTLHAPPRLSVLLERCRYCPIPVSLDGRCAWDAPQPKDSLLLESHRAATGRGRISVPAVAASAVQPSPLLDDVWLGKRGGVWPMRRLPLAWLVECQGRKPSSQARWTVGALIQLLLEPDDLDPSSEIVFCVDGVSLSPLWVKLPYPCRVVTEEPELTLDLSGFSVVKNSILDGYLSRLKERVKTLAAVARLHRESVPPPWPAALSVEGGLPRIFGHWLLLEEVERGWRIERFRARPRAGGHQQVLLTLFGGAEEAFHRHVRECQLARHPSLSALIEHGDKFDELYTVEEWPDGEPMRDLIEQLKLDSEYALRVFRELCRAVLELEALGVRTATRLTPGSILLGPDRVVLLSGRIHDPDELRVVQVGDRSLGYALWMSPEELAGLREQDTAHIYRLGLLAYLLFTGEHPLPQGQTMMIAYSHMHVRPPDPRQSNPAIPEHLAQAILTCLEKRPQDRFPTVADLLEATKN